MSDLNVLVNSQYLFLRSAQNNAYDTTYEFETDVLTSMPEHQMSLTVVDFTMQVQYYVVNDFNNELTFTKLSDWSAQTITIPPGNYSYRELCLMVSSLYGDVSCTYNKNTNKAEFRFTVPHSIQFINYSYKTFGFNLADSPSGTAIISANQLDLKQGVNQLVIHAEGVSTTALWNVDNFNSRDDMDTQPSDIMAVIPFDTAPFTVLH